MNEDINKKMQLILKKAKEGKKKAKSDNSIVQSGIANSLADHIKTQEQAQTFMTLLKAL